MKSRVVKAIAAINASIGTAYHAEENGDNITVWDFGKKLGVCESWCEVPKVLGIALWAPFLLTDRYVMISRTC